MIQLRIVAGEIVTADRVFSVALHANDCVHIHLPDYYRRRGDYTVALKVTERAQLDDLSRLQRSLPYTQEGMLAEAAALEARKVGGAELFAVAEADYVELTTRDRQTVLTTHALGLFQYAERYPEIQNLKAFEQLATALIALSRRDDLVAVAADAGGGR